MAIVMIKVCHLTSVHHSNDVRVFVKECTSLANNGYEVYLVAKGESRIQNHVHVIGVGVAPQNRIARMLFFLRKIYQKARELDCEIYHLHDPELLPIGLKLKKDGKKVIFDSHEMYKEQLLNKTYIPVFLRKTVSRMYSLYENKVLRNIDAVIFPCLYKGKHPFEGKCKIVETVDNMPLLEELYEYYEEDAPKEQNSVCYVGTLSKTRGVTNSVLATFLANGKLNLGGPFVSNQYRDELQKMPEYRCVIYKGEINRDQVRELLGKSMVGMANLLNVGQYNKYDNFATKVYEYMSLALPVILSNSEYNCRMMNKYRFGVCVDPDDVDEIAQAIEYLFKNPDVAKEMGENGRKAVRGYFNWDKEKEKLINLYIKVLNG